MSWVAMSVQAMAAREAAKALADRCAELERALEESAMAVGSSRRMRDEVEVRQQQQLQGTS